MKRKVVFYSGAAVILLFILAFVLSFYFFSVQVAETTLSVAKDRLEESAQGNAAGLRLMVQGDLKAMHALANQLSFLENPAEQLEAGRLRANVVQIGLQDLRFVPISESTREVPREGALRAAVDSGTDSRALELVVPVYEKRRLRGYLSGYYSKQLLQEKLRWTLLDDQGVFGIMNDQGDYYSPVSGWNQLLAQMEKATFSKGYGIQPLRESLEQGQSNYLIFRPAAEEDAGEGALVGETTYACFTSLGLEGWYAVAMAPGEYLDTERRGIETAVSNLLVILILCFAAIAVYIVMQSKRVRERVEEEREFYHRVLNAIPAPIFITDLEKKLTFVNDASFPFFGRKREDLIGKPCSVWDTPICSGEGCSIELLRKQGNPLNYFEFGEKSVQVTTATVLDGQKNHVGYIEVLQDITEIVKTHSALEEKTTELETITEGLEGGILITKMDEDFTVIRCNAGYCEMVGSSKNEVVGHSSAKWVAGEDRQSVIAEIKRQFSMNGRVAMEHRLRGRDGKKIWISLHGRCMQLDGRQTAVWMLSDINGLKIAEEKIRINEELYRLAIASTEDIIVDYDFFTGVMIHTSKATENYGVPERMEHALDSLIAPYGPVQKESEKELLEMFRRLKNGAKKESCVVRCKRLDGELVWNRLNFSTVFDDQNCAVRTVGVIQDVTVEMEQRYKYEREARFRDITMKDTILYYEVDLSAKCFIKGHEQIARLLSKPVSEEYDQVVQWLIDGVVYREDKDFVADKIEHEHLEAAFRQGINKTVFQYRRNRANAEPGWVECTIHMYEDAGSLKGFCFIKDIDETKKNELALRAKAERDLLTGLFNKMTCEMLVREYVSRSEGEGAFMIVDLDNFKQINDTLGHAFGDRVLTEIAKKLIDLFHASDIIGRIGGDEFLVFMKDCNKRAAICGRAQSVCDMFHATLIGGECRVSASIGIALFPEHAETFEQLYQKADTALYHSKHQGKDAYAVFSQEMLRE